MLDSTDTMSQEVCGVKNIAPYGVYGGECSITGVYHK